MFGGPVSADGLAYLDARPSAAPKFDVVPSHLQPLVSCCIMGQVIWRL